jgi:hypothetical protein
MRPGILLPTAGEITNDAVDVGGGRHEHVDRVEARLGLSIVRYGFDDFGLTLSKGSDGGDKQGWRTSHILL